MKRKVLATIKNYQMLVPGERIVVAVSGGPDSIALLSVLHALKQDYSLDLMAAHLNHCIRGDAALHEAEFVKDISMKLGIPFQYGESDVPGLQKNSGRSLEETARTERYKFLREVARECGAQKIALGHHRNDQVETVIMHILRGSGIRGLRGMLPIRDNLFIRPLLEIGRNEILAWLRDIQMPFMTDASNYDGTYLRNRIRHELIPLLVNGYHSKVEEAVIRLADTARKEDDYLSDVVKECMISWNQWPVGNEVSIRLPELSRLHEAVQNRIFLVIMNAMSGAGECTAQVHIKAIHGLVSSGKSEGYINLPGGMIAGRDHERLVFYKTGNEKHKRYQQKRNGEDKTGAYDAYCVNIPVSIPMLLHIPSQGVSLKFSISDQPGEIDFSNASSAAMDIEKVIQPLFVRSPRHGDRFKPFGMIGTKKLKNYFIDEKIPGEQRKKTLLLVDSLGILWIAGMRLDERCRLTENTGKILRVEII